MLRVELRGLERLRADERAVKGVLRSGVQAISRDVRRRLRGSGRTGRRYRKGGRTVTASTPAEAPARLTGTMAKSVRWNVGRNGMSAISAIRAPHTHLMFIGSRYIDPRPDLMAEALDEHAPRIESEIAEAFGRAFEGEG